MKLLLDENLSRRLVPFLQHDYPGSNQVVLLGMQSAGQPPKVIRLKTLNQTRPITLKLLIESRDVIAESLLDQDLAAIEIVF